MLIVLNRLSFRIERLHFPAFTMVSACFYPLLLCHNNNNNKDIKVFRAGICEVCSEISHDMILVKILSEIYLVSDGKYVKIVICPEAAEGFKYYHRCKCSCSCTLLYGTLEFLCYISLETSVVPDFELDFRASGTIKADGRYYDS